MSDEKDRKVEWDELEAIRTLHEFVQSEEARRASESIATLESALGLDVQGVDALDALMCGARCDYCMRVMTSRLVKHLSPFRFVFCSTKCMRTFEVVATWCESPAGHETCVVPGCTGRHVVEAVA